MTKKNLFILSTPSQAFFLSKAPELINKDILILTVRTQEEADAILVHLGKFDWEEVIVIKTPGEIDHFGKLKIIQFRFWLWRFKRERNHFEGIYMGSYSNFHQLSIIGEYENNSKIFLLYDGMQIIAVAHNRMDSDHKIRRLPNSFLSFKFKQPEIKSLNFVSPFPLEVKPTDSLKILKKDAGETHPQLDEEKVIVVGQPLVQLDIVSVEFYFTNLRGLKEKFSDKKVFYVPHPRENEDDIAKVAEIFEIKVFKGIFEEEYLNSAIFPKTVVSFYSSVLGNLCYLRAKTDIYAIHITESNFLRKQIHHKYLLTFSFIKDLDDSRIKIIEF